MNLITWMVQHADQINSGFEFIGLFTRAADIRQAYKDNDIKGVAVGSAIIYFIWCIEYCLFYYAYQSWYSFWMGVVFTVLNSWWYWLYFKYKFLRKINHGL
jgi:hypothetical protein